MTLGAFYKALFCGMVLLAGCTPIEGVQNTANSSAPATPTGQPNLADLPPDPSRPFVNLVSVKVKKNLLPQFLAELKPYAVQTREEPGVVRYDIHQSAHDPTVIELYEQYKDTAARVSHNNSEHRNSFFKKVKEAGYFEIPATSKTVYLIDPIP